jgi:hypothetical protein
MAWGSNNVSSFLCTSFVLSAMTHAGTAPLWNINGSDQIWLALYNNTGAYTPDTALANQAYGGSGGWSGNEVTGANWPAGGVQLSSTVLGNTSGQGGVLSFTAANVNVSTVTVAGVYGALVYDHTVSGGNNYGIAGLSFGGAYSSTAGPFAITWGAANGVSSVVWWIST